MLEILGALWAFILQAISIAWSAIAAVAVLGWDLLYHLHVSAPRLEGLLVGVALAWVLLRRDKHPLLRVLSAPLKLVLDVLDLAWDQLIEIIGDLWGTVRGWTQGALGWCVSKVRGGYDRVMNLLSGLKNRLSKSDE